MRSFLFKVLLPFAVTLAVGMALVVFIRQRQQAQQPATSTNANSQRATPQPSPALALPEVHVLSPMLMSEVLEFERRGGGYEGARVISPPGPHYAAVKPKDYKQGVLQLNFLFGADGTISEITPLAKPQDCSISLHSPNVGPIDPPDPRWSVQVKAATEAVQRIKF